MSFNIAEKAWLEAPIYTRAMDNYQMFVAKKQQKAGGDAKPIRENQEKIEKVEIKQVEEQVMPKESSSSLVNRIQETRNNIKAALSSENCGTNNSGQSAKLEERMEAIETENKALKTELTAMSDRFAALEARLNSLTSENKATEKEVKKEDEEDEDDVALFESDEEDEEAAAEAERIKAERVAAYNERKAAKDAKKGAIIAKSNIILDVKPWDDETDMGKLEQHVREITTEGLLWGAGKLVAVGYGIKKLQISCVVEDDKVGTDYLEDQITALEDYVQSMDIVAFNKI